MKVLLLAVALIPASLFAQQPTKAQLDKMQKDMEKLQKSVESGNKLPVAVDDDDEVFKAPKKQVKLLAAIPKTTFTTAQYTAYVKGLLVKFETQPTNKNAIAFVKKFNYKTAVEFYYSSFVFWYKGQHPEAIYAGLKSITLDPNNNVAMNNLAAMLNLSGYPHKAIPMLMYGSAKEKHASATILNNLGQAYYQLGDLPTAKTHLTSCVRIEQFNVEANNTLGHIESANGNSTVAAQHYQNSLKGGYNRSAASRLGKMDKKPEDALNLPAPSSYPETDDNIGFTCPTIPSSVMDNVSHNRRMQAESEAIDQAQQDYTTRINESMEQRARQLASVMMSGRQVNMHTGLMFEKASLVMAKAMTDCVEQMKRLTEQFNSQREALNQTFADRFTRVCEGVNGDDACCQARRNLQQEKQSAYSSLYQQFCAQMWMNAKGYSNVVHYWTPFLSTQRGNILDKDLMNARNTLFSTAFSLLRAAQVDEDFCLEDLEAPAVTKDPHLEKPDCKFNLKIPLGVADFKLDCEKFSFSGGEIAIGEIEYNFVTGQTTIAAGAGAKVSTGLVEAELSAKYYVTIDGNGTIQDVGVKYGSSFAAGQVRAGPVQFEAFSAEGAVTVGMNSGVNVSSSANAMNYNLFKQDLNVHNFK